MLIYVVQLHDVNACVSYVISTTGISGPTFILRLHIFNTHRYHFLNACTINKTCALLPTAHIIDQFQYLF